MRPPAPPRMLAAGEVHMETAQHGDEAVRPDVAYREVIVVANGNASGAGRHGGPEAVAAAVADLGIRPTVLRTRDASEMAAVWRPAPGRLVMLLGGDGTLHCAVNLPGPPPDVALLPAGLANNVARCLGIPTDPVAAARVALAGRPLPIDLIECRSGDVRVVAVEGVSVGFLALARARYHSSNSADVPAAVAAGAAALLRFHPFEVRLVEHGTAGHAMHIGQLFVANMPCFGTGLRVAPHADPRDGLLDVVAIDVPGRRSLPAMLARLRRGTHLAHHGVREWRASGVTIETRGRSPVMADTCDLGPGPVAVRVMPSALRVVVPAAGCT
jgi:diacylglycerol kinase (ATP)